MNPYRRPFGMLSSPWIVSGASVAALAVLTLLLWNPWSETGVVSAAPLRFYCAANVTKPVQQIIEQYQGEYGVEVQATFAWNWTDPPSPGHAMATSWFGRSAIGHSTCPPTVEISTSTEVRPSIITSTRPAIWA